MKATLPALAFACLCILNSGRVEARDPIYLHYHGYEADLGQADWEARQADALTRLDCPAQLRTYTWQEFARIDQWVYGSYNRPALPASAYRYGR